MFPDSKIASSFQMGPDKLHYYVTFGLAPYFKSLLNDTLKKSDCHFVSFDESLSDFTQSLSDSHNTRCYKIYMKGLMIYQMD